MDRLRLLGGSAIFACVAIFAVPTAFGHGDVQPQPVDTAGLDPVGADWAEENPYRLKGGDQYAKAIEIGASGYNQNCARCHGLEVKSGGLAPDLRHLDDGIEGDEWFLQRIRKGYSQDGTYKMPPFQDVLTQEAMWAIRSYVETRPDD
jgi:cytochrome c-550 PedF